MKSKSMQKSALILDDEPHLLDWLADYLQRKGLATKFVTNVGEAIEAIQGENFRLLVLDLNVPTSVAYAEAIRKRGPTYEEFRGLYVAEYARNLGYRGRQVIVYSVHDLEAVRAVTDRIGVTYCVKGRAQSFKAEIDDVLSFDPTATPTRKRTR
jgi:CheY-like chemotaxis protein